MKSIISKLKDLRIFYKLLSFGVFFILVFWGISYYAIIPKIEENIYNDKKQAVKQTVDVAYKVIEYYGEKSSKGIMSVSEAQEAAKNEIKKLRYNKNDYFWINNSEPRMIMHPMKSKLDGKMLDKSADPNGKHLFVEFVKVCKENGYGYVNYMWPKPGFDEPQDKISFVKLYKDWDWIIGSGIYIDDVQTQLSEIANTLYVLLGFVSLITLLISSFFGRFLAKPLENLNQVSVEVAKGNTEVQASITSNDEIGQLGSAINNMIASINSSMKNAEAKSKEAESAAYEANQAKLLAEENQQYLNEKTNILLELMDRFANGDLTVRAEIEKQDDQIGRVFAGFNSVVSNMQNLINQVIQSVNATVSAVNQISSSTEEMAAGAQEQSAQSAEVAGAIEQMTRTIIDSTKNSGIAAENSRIAKEAALAGGEVVEKNISGMNKISEVVNEASKTIAELGDSSHQIGEIIQVINDIADQTNLLALNAAIEAARAGEQGRGFAVVADEVRKLAERTTKATKEIASMIVHIQEATSHAVDSIQNGTMEVENGKSLAIEAGKSLKEIITQSESVTDVITYLASASEEQSVASEEISRNIEAINGVTQETASGIQEMAHASENLSQLANNLYDLTKAFNLNSDNQSGSEYQTHESFVNQTY